MYHSNLKKLLSVERQTHIDEAESVVAADECVELKPIMGRI